MFCFFCFFYKSSHFQIWVRFLSHLSSLVSLPKIKLNHLAEVWTRVTWLGPESDSSHKYDDLQLDFESWLDLDLSLNLTWYPPQAQILKMMLFKNVCSASTLHSFHLINRLQFESDSSQSNCANWEEVVRGSAEERRRVNSDGALGKMIPQMIIFRYKDYAASTKNGL